MLTGVSPKLTWEQFEEQYGRCDRSYEFWYGEAIPKGMPTWIHGALQQIVSALLRQAGYFPASEVELRIETGARPKPDIVAAKTKFNLSRRYPVAALDVVIEILSDDDSYLSMQAHCRKYREWGFIHIYLVNPVDRLVVEWRDDAQTVVSSFAGIPVERIWEELDLQSESDDL